MLCEYTKAIGLLLFASVFLFVSSVKATVNSGSTLPFDHRDVDRVRNLQFDVPFLENLKARNQLKGNVSIVLQEYIDHSLQVDGQWVSINQDDLEEIDVFEKGAKFYLDGIMHHTLPSPMVYTSKVDPSITIVKGDRGRLVRATKIDPVNGKTVSIVPVDASAESGLFIAVHEEDIDDEMMKNFAYGDQELWSPEELPGGERYLGAVEQPMLRGGHRRHRSLAACTSYDVIEIAVVIDSTFCAYHGNVIDAAAQVQSIVAATSKRYEQEGVCARVRLIRMDAFCNPAMDPFVQILKTADGICGNHATR